MGTTVLYIIFELELWSEMFHESDTTPFESMMQGDAVGPPTDQESQEYFRSWFLLFLSIVIN